jgi:integrase
MTFAFARVGAVVAMRVEDYYPNGKRWWVRLHEKGGKRHEMPAHHNLEAYLDAYIKAAGVGDEGKSPLFRSAAGRTGALTVNRMNRVDAWRMIQRRAAELGLRDKIGCHTFRATGITPSVPTMLRQSPAGSLPLRAEVETSHGYAPYH